MDIAEISEFVKRNDVTYGCGIVFYNRIIEAKELIGLEFGPELTSYLRNYGYLCYGSIEFYGLRYPVVRYNNLIEKTLYLHKKFPETKKLVAIENRGENDFYLVDCDDNVFEFDITVGKLNNINKKFFNYILSRLKSVY